MMKRSKRFAALILTGVMAVTTLLDVVRHQEELPQIAQRQTAHQRRF